MAKKSKRPEGKHTIDFDLLNVIIIGTSEYESLLSYRDEYWRMIKILKRLIPSTPTFNPTEMLQNLRS